MSQANNIYSRISENQYVKNVIYSNGIIDWVTVYFKEAYTTNIKYYNIPINWTMDTFINAINKWVEVDFGLRGRNYNYTVNIIEMGQEIPGIKPEDARELEDGHITYYNKYIANNKWPGFYIKIS
jgi:hypothetical protein